MEIILRGTTLDQYWKSAGSGGGKPMRQPYKAKEQLLLWNFTATSRILSGAGVGRAYIRT
jgi:hypothetical protein